MLRLYAELVSLNLRTRFQVEDYQTIRFETVVVAITDPVTGRIGFGESAANPFYTKPAREIWAELQLDGEPMARDADERELLDRCRWLTPAARSGVVGALLDLAGQADRQPVWQRWSPTPDCPPSTLTVASPTLAGLAGELDGLTRFRPTALKVKISPFVNHAEHRQRLTQVRDRFPTAELTVEMNASWQYEQFTEAIDYLAGFGVSRVEEPLTLDAPLSDYAKLARDTPFSLVADERLLQHSLDELALCFAEVNLKSAYHGGILGVGSKLARVRARGLRACLGCNFESSVGIAAIAQLAPLADHLDIDSALLVADDPFRGIGWAGSRPVLGTEPGIGVRLVDPSRLSSHLGRMLESRRAA